MMTKIRRRAALLCACSLVVASCSGSSPGADVESSAVETAVTVAPSTTTAETAPGAAATDTQATPAGDLLDPEYLAGLASNVSPSDGAVMVVVVDPAGDAVVGSAGGDAAGNAPTAGDAVRIGSITKVFTALTTLSLAEAGLVDLDAPAADVVTRVPVDADITVRDLLGHRSGIDSYTDVAGFWETVVAESERVWEPEEQVELVADRPALFDPGDQYSYSNTNYIILGILIEEVTGQPYHEVVRERILDPLEMSSTYLAGFEEGAEPFDPFVEESDTEYDYTSIATSAWSAGAMVSSAVDLHSLFTALFGEQILSGATVDELTASSFYGLGVELDQWHDGLIGHSGSIPGYRTFLRYSTDSGITAFLVSTDDNADPTPAIGAVVELLGEDVDERAVEAAEPPPNDRFANAVVVDPTALPFAAAVDTTGATADDDDLAVGCPAPATEASVWYSITPARDVKLLVSPDGSDYSVGISALTGDAGSFELIECRPFSFVIEAEADVTYHLQVFDGQEDGQEDGRGTGGNLVFSLEAAP